MILNIDINDVTTKSTFGLTPTYKTLRLRRESQLKLDAGLKYYGVISQSDCLRFSTLLAL